MVKLSLFKEVFYQSRIPQTIGSIDFKTYEFNNAFAEFLGYTIEEISKFTNKDVSHPEDYDNSVILLNGILNGEQQQYQMEKRYYTKTGELKTGLLTVSLLQDEATNEIFYLGQVIDLTEKIQYENTLKQSERKYRLLAENSSDIIALHEEDGTYLYISPSVKLIIGYEPEEMLGKRPIDFVHPDDISNVWKINEKVMLQKDPVVCTFRCRRKDGNYVWLESKTKAVFIEETGEISEVISVIRDIQQRMETDELLRRSEKLAVVGQMAAAVAHEIRNPLTPIKGFMQLISSGTKCNHDFSTIILNEITRIENIISEFLSLAKPHSEKSRAISIDILVRQVIELLKPEAIYQNKDINFLARELVPNTIGDPNSLKQVFVNIIQNALDATAEKGKVDVIISQIDKSICVQIVDNGCGIPSERISRLGEPFYSTKEKGTGLGLMTSYKIIEDHHGSIKIESQEGKGTTVSIYLPIEEFHRNGT